MTYRSLECAWIDEGKLAIIWILLHLMLHTCRLLNFLSVVTVPTLRCQIIKWSWRLLRTRAFDPQLWGYWSQLTLSLSSSDVAFQSWLFPLISVPEITLSLYQRRSKLTPRKWGQSKLTSMSTQGLSGSDLQASVWQVVLTFTLVPGALMSRSCQGRIIIRRVPTLRNEARRSEVMNVSVGGR